MGDSKNDKETTQDRIAFTRRHALFLVAGTAFMSCANALLPAQIKTANGLPPVSPMPLNQNNLNQGSNPTPALSIAPQTAYADEISQYTPTYHDHCSGRLAVTCTDSYLELISSDYVPGEPEYCNCPTSLWGALPTGWAGYSFRNGEGNYKTVSFPVWSVANGQDDISWYDAWCGTWTRCGRTYGDHQATYTYNDSQGNSYFGGYGYGGNVLSKHGGPDAELIAEAYRFDHVRGEQFHTSDEITLNFYPRIQIYYIPTEGSLGNMSVADIKYIGTEYTIHGKPTRVGYIFRYWKSDWPSGNSNIYKENQRVGAEDWNTVSAANPSEGGYISALYSHTPICDPFSKITSKDSTWTNNGSHPTTFLYAVWDPINYTVTYFGNGETEGTTPQSTHVYDQWKNLTKNGFKRISTLTYDSQGGSNCQAASCPWIFQGWAETQADNPKKYNDEHKVINLTTTAADNINLYALWSPQSTIFPEPIRTGYKFDGWYTAANDGEKVGDSGTKYTVQKDETLYAHWHELAKVEYYVDGATTPIYTDNNVIGSYQLNQTANSLAIKNNCHHKDGSQGFDGWYTDSSYSQKYYPHDISNSGTTKLYGRNWATVTYFNEDKYRGKSEFDLVLPQAEEAPYGTIDNLKDVSKNEITYSPDDSMSIFSRTLRAQGGWYGSSNCTDNAFTSMKIANDASVYKHWDSSTYDGIESNN
jgi:uncharacterized repeat protein (TIGR02543 family)